MEVITSIDEKGIPALCGLGRGALPHVDFFYV